MKRHNDQKKNAPSDQGMAHQERGARDQKSHHAHMAADFRRRFWISIVATLPILVLSPMIQGFLGLSDALSFRGDQWILLGLATFILGYGGYPFLKGMVDELGERQPGMMTLVAVAISVAYIYSAAVVLGLGGKVFFWELATLVDVMLLGHWIEMRSVMGASNALQELAALLPDTAHRVLENGETEQVPLDALQAGDPVLIKPGERIPADGEIIQGESAINESMLTGESAPVHKTAGDQVIGGSINTEGSVTVRITQTGDGSYLSQAMELVRQAQEAKSRTQSLADRAAVILTLIALAGGAITFAVWHWWVGNPLDYSLERSVTVMVITCPHALGLAIPLVVAMSTSIGAKRGLLIRDRSAFERARNIQAMLFDKTGTLTQGEFGVSDVVLLDANMDRASLLRYAAAVESRSEHPIAQGIIKEVDQPAEVTDFQSITGRGVKGHVDGKLVHVASPGYLEEKGWMPQDNQSQVNQLADEGKTLVYVLLDETVKGVIALADVIRPESKEAIQRLKEMGIQCMMITGDNAKVANWVGRELELDEVMAEVLPDAKSAKVKAIQDRGLIVAMTGDGINDAPALAQADVGIAIGAGTNVAIEAADIVLVRNNPLDAVSIIGLAEATYVKMVQNLAWATGYNVIAIPLAAGVLAGIGVILSPAIGALLMSLSTVIVAINARRLAIE